MIFRLLELLFGGVGEKDMAQRQREWDAWDKETAEWKAEQDAWREEQERKARERKAEEDKNSAS